MYRCPPEEIRQETLALIRDAFDDHRGLTVCPTPSPYMRGKGEVERHLHKCFLPVCASGRGT